MKTADFLNMFPTVCRLTPVLFSALICYSANTLADAPPPETFTQSPELVLTLSDEWLTDEDTGASRDVIQKQNHNATAVPANSKLKNTPVNVGCGMDVNQAAGDSNSLTGRLVGECKFHYNY